MNKTEAAFRALLEKRHCSIDWRSCIAIEGPAAYVAGQARCADLIVTGWAPSAGLGVNIGDLIMESGRPVLSIPHGVSKLTFEHAIVAWNDTREARLATAAALPLLKIASRVSIMEIAEAGDMESARRHVQDVTHWLARHGIHAGPSAVAAENDQSRTFGDMAKTQGADLIVAGAYGHSRLREWVLGGFTRHLLNGVGCCALVMH
jgi:nucleotide-binding universal stress UspA family protein